MTITRSIENVQALLGGGKLAEAEQITHELALQHPSDPRPWQLLAHIYTNSGRQGEASQCIQRAIALSSNDPVYLLQFAQNLLHRGYRSQALEVANMLASRPLDRPEWNDALGTLLTYCEESARALEFFERAVAGAPCSRYLYNLASAQRMVGDLSRAEATLDRVISIDPPDVRAHYTRSDLRTQTTDCNHIGELTRLLNSESRRPEDQIMLCFTLAKELEDVGRYDESFAHLRRGCELQRASIRYDVNDDIATIDQIIELHDAGAIEGDRGFDSDECIFVFGLPRSGTTLLEQILSCHSGVHAAGELHTFPAQTVAAVYRRVAAGTVVDKRAFVKHSLDVDPWSLGRSYLDATRPQTGHTPRFVDKLPLNYLYAGLIRRALPRARMIALAREPMDCCYAMYKALFSRAYPFSYSLTDLAHYYIAWHRLMRHWCAVLGERLMIVHYEDLVGSQEAITRRVVAHCGLPWEDRCLTFHRERTAVSTASAVQIRRPIYSSSVGKWKQVERQLAPLAKILKAHEPACGWRLP